MNCGHVQLLDCTLRDGGQGLETAHKTMGSEAKFTDEIIEKLIQHLVETDIEIIELGYIEESGFSGHPFANCASIEEISKFVPAHRNPNQMYVALYTGPGHGDANPGMDPSLVGRNPRDPPLFRTELNHWIIVRCWREKAIKRSSSRCSQCDTPMMN